MLLPASFDVLQSRLICCKATQTQIATEIMQWKKFRIGTSVSVCQFQAMSPVVYAPRMKVIHTFGGTFPVTDKVFDTFFIIVIDNRCYI